MFVVIRILFHTPTYVGSSIMQFISLGYFITPLFTIEITSGWRKSHPFSSISTLLIGFVVVTSASARPMSVAYTPVLLEWILTSAYSKVL